MAFDLDNEELKATRKMHGQDDGLYEETSDKKFKNDKIIARKFAVMQQQINEKDSRIQELEEELEKANRQLDLDYVDENYITKEKVKELEEESKKVLDLIFEYGQIDGGHHKMWVIDQIVRILTKDKYNEWIKNYVYDEETGDTYSWDKGIAP